MLQMISQYLPTSVKKPIKQALIALKKPVLNYVEFHLTDHCNLRCKGCGHFSTIASPNYAEIGQYESDLNRLRKLFSNINVIRLMGGEPLLHPHPESFITVTRELFPLADIRFVTNGTLLSKARESFWKSCRDTRTIIDMTVYPPFRSRVAALLSLCKSMGVSMTTSAAEHFHAKMNLQGNSDERTTFLHCRSRFFCPFLENGHLYTCAGPAVIRHFNDRFDYRIPADQGIDLYDHFLSGRKVLELLNRPIANCRYCLSEDIQFAWTQGTQQLEEWDAEAQRCVQAGRPHDALDKAGQR
jgi:radical SAM family protein